MDLKQWLLQRIAQVVAYGLVTRATENGDDAMDGRALGSQIPARRMGPWGVRGVPVLHAECIAISPDGAAGNKVIIAAEKMVRVASGLRYQYGPTDMTEGETALYDAAGSVVHLRADGSVTIVPKAGAKVKIGDAADVAVDPVVLFHQLKSDFDAFVAKYNAHGHPADNMPPPMTSFAAPLSAACASSNVHAKK